MGDADWLEEPVHSGSVMESVRRSASSCGRRKMSELSCRVNMPNTETNIVIIGKRTSLSTAEKILKNPEAHFTPESAILRAYVAVRWSPETGERDSREKEEVEKSTSNNPRKFSECGLVPGKIKTPNVTVNETRRKKMEAIIPSQPTLTESEGNWRCQGICLQNLERAVGVAGRAAPRPVFLARKVTYDDRGAVETTHPLQEDT
ncbi:uncharacterized protein LOC141946689 isoform X3 [Strix uralensis]|uniref:uncharacterized protein LOC141946689 isoform X3 n=2 Tax=Strix uralensis TaxID=36305 RepID=UPI003DA77D28